MKFKVVKGTNLFEKLIQLACKMRECDEAAYALMQELSVENIRRKSGVLAGGISSFVFEGAKPAGWRKSDNGRKGEYFPSSRIKANQPLLERIHKLPVVEHHELNDLLNYKWRESSGTSGSYRIYFYPGVHWKATVVLISIQESYNTYVPVEGMEEITVSEFNKLDMRPPLKHKIKNEQLCQK